MKTLLFSLILGIFSLFLTKLLIIENRKRSQNCFRGNILEWLIVLGLVLLVYPFLRYIPNLFRPLIGPKPNFWIVVAFSIISTGIILGGIIFVWKYAQKTGNKCSNKS